MPHNRIGQAEQSAAANRTLRVEGVSLTAGDLSLLKSYLPSRGDVVVARSVHFDRIKFKDDVDFSDFAVLGDMTFIGCTFEREARFQRARLGAVSTFRDCDFRYTASFVRGKFGQATFAGCIFRGDADFTGANFARSLKFYDADSMARVEIADSAGARTGLAPVGVRHCTFKAKADFSDCQFMSTTSMRGSKYMGSTSFDGAVFRGRADWVSAEFHDRASFTNARFKAEAIFVDTQFHLAKVDHPGSSFWDRSPNSFHGVHFDDEVHISGQFAGHADFKRCRFRSTAAFTDSTFQAGCQFNGSSFALDATFHMVLFQGSADFANVEFRGECGMTQATFGRGSRFYGARFHMGLDAERAIFEGDPSFEHAEFGKSINFARTQWAGTPHFTDAVIQCELIDLYLASFQQFLKVSLGSAIVTADRARFAGGGLLELGHCSTLSMEECEILAPLSVARAAGTTASPKLLSIRRTNVSQVSVEDVSMAACLFDGAHGLDQIRIDGGLLLNQIPRGFRARRQVIMEEVLLRRSGERARGWSSIAVEPWGTSTPLSHGRVASIYRRLRKGREDGRDEPGAADLYYGEMEMRRLDPSRSIAERAVLNLYWATAGYGLRASRAFGCLIATLAVSTLLFFLVGISEQKVSYTRYEATENWSGQVQREAVDLVQPKGVERLEAAIRLSLDAGTSLVRSPSDEVTFAGTVIGAFARLLGPLFLGLAIFSLRGRVKR